MLANITHNPVDTAATLHAMVSFLVRAARKASCSLRGTNATASASVVYNCGCDMDTISVVSSISLVVDVVANVVVGVAVGLVVVDVA